MQGCTEETEQAYLFPVLQPLVEPVWEAPVLCAVVQLKESGQHPRQVNKGQHDIGDARQRGVDDLHRDLVELALVFPNVRMQNLPDEVVGVEAKKQTHGQEDGDLPGREKTQGNILNLAS